VINLGNTQSGDNLSIALNNLIFTATGLVGTAKVMPGVPPGQSGETVVITASPHGSQSFEAFDICSCSFGGQHGTVRIVAYGTTAANGTLTAGVFLIASGGGTGGHLETLAGYGTFTSAGLPSNGSVRLVEHLAIS